MDVKLHPNFANDGVATGAVSAIEACVHCGFCLSSCPTYLDSRDERDSPRGRIYLIRELLQEGQSSTPAQHHLDRCLGCRACETSCPSGVRYGEIADAGRALLEDQLLRSAGQRLLRGLLRKTVPHPRRFGPLLWIGQRLRPALPKFLRAHIPAPQTALPRPAAQPGHPRRVVLLEGCVQSAATPRTNQATRLVLDRLGVSVIPTPSQGCCGALNTHLGHLEAGRAAMRRNIDAWWPAVDDGAEAIVFTATGCGAELVDYGSALADDPDYADKARRISELAQDLAAFLTAEPLAGQVRAKETRTAAIHTPCSQYHALRSPRLVHEILKDCGYILSPTRDDHLCCGSAGSYSILQPAMSGRLRARKLDALTTANPTCIATANVGCQLHLQAEAGVPVVHWVELVWDAIA